MQFTNGVNLIFIYTQTFISNLRYSFGIVGINEISFKSQFY